MDEFKDRNATRDAWREVCCALKEGFEELQSKEKNEFGKAVTNRWGNLRDAFSKSKRKLKECKRSGASAPEIKKYIYADQMQFLNKLDQSREVAESLEDSTVVNNDGDADGDQPQQSSVQGTESLLYRKQDNSHKNNTGHKTRRCPDEVELKMLKALEQPAPSAHMLFFQGLLPHSNKFDDDEVLEFQMGVLMGVISKINDKKKTGQPLPPQTQPFYHQNHHPPQPPSFPHPQSSYSNQLHSNNNFQAHFSQTHLSQNAQNLNYSLTNNLPTCSSRRQPESQQETSTAQYCPQFGQSSAVTAPDIYPVESPSPAASVSTDNNSYDFS